MLRRERRLWLAPAPLLGVLRARARATRCLLTRHWPRGMVRRTAARLGPPVGPIPYIHGHVAQRTLSRNRSLASHRRAQCRRPRAHARRRDAALRLRGG